MKEDSRVKSLGLEDIRKWDIYTIKSNPGLIFIRNPFTCLGQRFWIRKCLEEYSRKPNKTNIDFEMDICDWWSESHKNNEYDKLLLKKMRWATLGYHHNWNTKVKF